MLGYKWLAVSTSECRCRSISKYSSRSMFELLECREDKTRGKYMILVSRITEFEELNFFSGRLNLTLDIVLRKVRDLSLSWVSREIEIFGVSVWLILIVRYSKSRV